MITNLIASAKTDEEKIQAYQVKLQAIAAAQYFAWIESVTWPMRSSPGSRELQAFGLEIKLRRRSRAADSKSAIADFVDFPQLPVTRNQPAGS